VDSENEQGYFRNLAGGSKLPGKDIKAGRLGLRYFGNGFVDGTLTLNYERRVEGSNLFIPTYQSKNWILNIQPTGRDNNYARSTIWDVTGEVNFTFDDHWSLKSLTSYREVQNGYQEKSDGLPQIILVPTGSSRTTSWRNRNSGCSIKASKG